MNGVKEGKGAIVQARRCRRKGAFSRARVAAVCLQGITLSPAYEAGDVKLNERVCKPASTWKESVLPAVL